MSQKIEKKHVKVGKKWPKAHCPKCRSNGITNLVGLAQDGFPFLKEWWFFCGLCDYSQRVAAIGEIAKCIKAVDSNT